MVSKSSLGPDNNPGGAVWCEEHKRLECRVDRKKGRGPCHQAAVRGMKRCFIHSGTRLSVMKVQGEARIGAWTPYGKADKPISASMAVLGMLQMSWLRVGAYSELLRQQVALQGGQTQALDGDDTPLDNSGLIGFRYGAAGKEGHIYPQSEEIRALVALEAAERDRVVKYAKAAHDMGISSRLTDLAEKWGDMVAASISALLEELSLTPEQAVRVPSLIQSHLGSISLEALGAAADDKSKTGSA